MALTPDRILDFAPAAIVCADRDGTIRSWNQAAERLFGYRADEAIGQSLDIIVPERFRDAHWKGFNRAVAEGRLAKMGDAAVPTRAMRKDESTMIVNLAAALVPGEDGGAIAGVVAALSLRE